MMVARLFGCCFRFRVVFGFCYIIVLWYGFSSFYCDLFWSWLWLFAVCCCFGLFWMLFWVECCLNIFILGLFVLIVYVMLGWADLFGCWWWFAVLFCLVGYLDVFVQVRYLHLFCWRLLCVRFCFVICWFVYGCFALAVLLIIVLGLMLLWFVCLFDVCILFYCLPACMGFIVALFACVCLGFADWFHWVYSLDLLFGCFSLFTLCWLIRYCVFVGLLDCLLIVNLFIWILAILC